MISSEITIHMVGNGDLIQTDREKNGKDLSQLTYILGHICQFTS